MSIKINLSNCCCCSEISLAKGYAKLASMKRWHGANMTIHRQFVLGTAHVVWKKQVRP